MGRIKKYEEWIAEDFAAVGVAPEGNVIGMGNATPPTATSFGSGDMWPSLGTPSKKRRKKRKKKKVNEGSSDLHQDSDISYLSDATLSGAAIDSSVSTKDWVDFFSTIYQVDADFLSQTERGSLREIFSTERMSVWVTFDWEAPGETDSKIAYEKDGWDIIATDTDGGSSENAVRRIMVKPYTEKELVDNYNELLHEIKTNRQLSKKEFHWLFSLLKEEDKVKLKGHSTGKEFGV